jgi:hypothetical protein
VFQLVVVLNPVDVAFEVPCDVFQLVVVSNAVDVDFEVPCDVL